MDNCRYQLKDERHSSHSRVFGLLGQARPESKILEVGIAGGYLGQRLSGHNVQITAIEKESCLAEQAKALYDQILVLDLNKEQLPDLGPFDFIVLADILEHLSDPQGLLKKMYRLLKAGGTAIISVPNVANWFIRSHLLLGNFDYADRGILDRSHLKFFTLKTARELIREAGFKIVDCYPTSLPFQLRVKPKWFSAWANESYYPLARLFPGLFAYQFVFTAGK